MRAPRAGGLRALILILALGAASAAAGQEIEPKALIKTFASYVGIKEDPMGSNRGAMVDKFNASCGMKAVPWCASVAHYGYVLHGKPSAPGAYSPSWYRKTRKVSPLDVRPGDAALVWFPSMGRYGHTIACIERVRYRGKTPIEVVTLEGNTYGMSRPGVREGDQFARRIRPADQLTFVRWWTDK